MNGPMHTSASGSIKCKLDGCEVIFTPTKHWQAFCCTEHRNKFHHAKAVVPAMEKRISALEARMVQLAGSVVQIEGRLTALVEQLERLRNDLLG